MLSPLIAVILFLTAAYFALAVGIGRLLAGCDDRLDEFEDETA